LTTESRGDEEVGQPEAVLQVQQQVDDACLIDTSSADTGSSRARIFGCSASARGDADALLLSAGEELARVAAGVGAAQPDDIQ
jgi:hypothetical protein